MTRGVGLRGRERRILDAVADGLLPPGGRPAPGGAEAGAGDAAAAVLSGAGPRWLGWVVRMLLWLLEAGTWMRTGTPLSRLPVPARPAAVGWLTSGPVLFGARALQLLKHLLVGPYLASEEVAPAIGYDREAWLASREERGGLPASSGLSPVTWPDVPRRIACDAVVVGSGAGGGPVAALLAEAGRDVVVLEEGGHHTREELRATPVFERFTRLYRDVGLTGALGRPPIPVPVGRAVGGTTVVNAGTSLRPPDRVLRAWASDLALPDIDPAAMAPRLAAVEEVQAVGPPPGDVLGTNAVVCRRGLEALTGDPGEVLCRSQRGCRGCGESVAGCPMGAKQAVHLTWLPRAERAGATILARVRADRIRHDHARARGVEATVLDPGPREAPRGRLTVDAPLVVIAAGALHTPGLLARSGIPDPSGLRGRNLQIHPATGVTAVMPDDVHSWRGVLQSWGSRALVDSHGIMIEATAAPPPLIGSQLPFAGGQLKEVAGLAPRLATVGFLIEDSTTGSVHRAPGGRAVARYQLTDGDLRRISEGFAFVGRALLAAGAERILVGTADRPWADDPETLRDLADRGLPPEALRLSAYHPVGTHRLAGRAHLGPCDPWGKVRGTAGLWVADASLVPSCLGVNPQITVMALAVRAAERILTGG